MYAKTTLLLAGCIGAGLLSCTTPVPPGRVGLAIPPPEISIDLPLERPPGHQPFKEARACLLGATGSCMAMDSRPFEPCLVGAKSCEVKGTEVIKVVPPVYIDPARGKSR
jgi:hypothetical protein